MALHVMDEANHCLGCKVPRCQQGCPIHTNIPEVIRLLKANKLDEAGRMLFENNPLTTVCSLVCNHENQCEGHCVRGIKGAPVHFSVIENYISSTYASQMTQGPAPSNGKKAAIIGSGPAGLSAALTAAREGHKVTVFERGPRIGGCLVLSSVFSPMYERLIKYYKAVLPKYPNIDIRCNKKVTAEFVKKCAPEVVIVAVGGECIDGDMPGTDGKNVVRSHDFLELLNGRPPQKPGIVNKVLWNAGYVFLHFIYTPKLINFALKLPSPWPVGKKVAIIGGGLPGCEMGMKLTGGWRKMNIFETGKIGYDVGSSERFIVRNTFKTADDVEMHEKSRVVSITDSGVYAVNENGQEDFYEANTVAVTLGFKENRELYEQVKDLAPQVFIVGDCNEPKRMADATKAGYRAAASIK